jgi:1-acyl-sn-glycerol-3-phosphate acyltransferase
VQVEGSERIAPGSTYVFAANHRSYLDLPCILAHFPPRVRFLVDKRLFSLPLVGGYLRRGGHLPITNASAREALTSMSDAAETAKASGMSFFVFPEGTRSRGPLFRFKDGAAYIAIRAGIPIVPVALSGTGALLPVGSLVIRSGLARLEIGSPVPTLDLSLQDRTVLSRTLRRTIEQHRWQLAGAHRS